MIRRFVLFVAVVALAAALGGLSPAATPAAGRSVPEQEILADSLFREAAALDSDAVS